MRELLEFIEGERLVCVSNQAVERYLTRGMVYTATRNQEPGIFASDPYIKIINDRGNEWTCHASRFKRAEVSE